MNFIYIDKKEEEHSPFKYDKDEKLFFLKECGWQQEEDDIDIWSHPLLPAMEDFSSEKHIDKIIETFYMDLWRFTRRLIQAGNIFEENEGCVEDDVYERKS